MQKKITLDDLLASNQTFEQKQIGTRNDLANFLEISPKYLNYVLYSRDRCRYYQEKIIKKATGKGKIRILHAVKGKLKELQRQALNKFQSEEYYKEHSPSFYSHGFTKDKNIITNAAYHRRSKLIIKLDLQDFFPNINFGRVQGMFMAQPFNFGKEAATTMAQIACLPEGIGIPDREGSLPQGGVLSPYISNMICRRLDKRLARLSQESKYRYRFTRYADDITFSTNNVNTHDVEEFIEEVRKIIESENFAVNEEKTKRLTRKDRQVVTGVVVNDGLNVNRKYIRNLRATIRNCEKFGITTQVIKKGGFDDPRNSRIAQEGDSDSSEIYFLKHLVGKLNFFCDVILRNIMVKDKTGEWIHYAKSDFEEKNGIDLNTYKRLKTHAKLTTRFYQLLITKGGKYKEIEKALVGQSKKNPELLTMTLIAEKSEFIRNFLYDYKKNHPGSKYPPIDKKKTQKVLQSLRNSDENLGALVHTVPDFTFEQGMKLLLEEYYPNKYYLPSKLQNTFDDYIKAFEQLGVKCGALGVIDVVNDLGIAEKTKELKRNTRLDPSERSLKDLLKECLTDAKKQKDVKKDIQIEYINIGNEHFYTHVPSIETTIKNILHSMLKNTNGDTVFIETKLIKEEDVLELSIYDKEQHDWLFNKNGKMDLATINTEGLCHYWVEADDHHSARKCIDMHTQKFITPPQARECGFVHRLRFHIESSTKKQVTETTPDTSSNRDQLKVLLLDCKQERREKMEKTIRKIPQFSVKSLGAISPEQFTNGQFDIAFIHINNLEVSNSLKDWNTANMKLIYFSGGGQSKHLEKLDKNQWQIGKKVIDGVMGGQLARLNTVLKRMEIL